MLAPLNVKVAAPILVKLPLPPITPLNVVAFESLPADKVTSFAILIVPAPAIEPIVSFA